jgi:hypothetical protein
MADHASHGGAGPKGQLVATQDDDRAAAWSRELVGAHEVLRERLVHLRANLGEARVEDLDFATRCLAFCSALDLHHVAEDEGMFPDLLHARPDLQPVVANLMQDHQMIAGILTTVRDLAAEATGATEERRAAIGRELDGLAAIVESHFTYEERSLRDALDA